MPSGVWLARAAVALALVPALLPWGGGRAWRWTPSCSLSYARLGIRGGELNPWEGGGALGGAAGCGSGGALRWYLPGSLVAVVALSAGPRLAPSPMPVWG